MTKRKVGALFVDENGPYVNDERFSIWGESKDARNYDEKFPVIAHPPCERWGRYWFGGPSAKERKILGNDGGCFHQALVFVKAFGGVLEHPAHSYAWDYFSINKPNGIGWFKCERHGGWVTEVCQGHYGHKAEKRTWLLVCGVDFEDLPKLKWGRCPGMARLDEGFHSKEERQRARENGLKPRRRLTRLENIHTPPEFIEVLYSIATKVKSEKLPGA